MSRAATRTSGPSIGSGAATVRSSERSFEQLELEHEVWQSEGAMRRLLPGCFRRTCTRSPHAQLFLYLPACPEVDYGLLVSTVGRRMSWKD